MNVNPIIAELTRGGIVESIHRGAYAVVGADGKLIAGNGDIASPVFPRSAIKAIQGLPLVASGAAAKYGFTHDEIAQACSSHNGEPRHVETVLSMLRKADVSQDMLECGAHWPTLESSGRDLASKNQLASSIHNNCSGKHAGMIATAKYLGEDISGYIKREHPVQQRIEAIISDYCECDLVAAACGLDGCSVPTWAIPLENLALGFAKIGNYDKSTSQYASASRQIVEAARLSPFNIAGTDRFCTNIMTDLPRVFAKNGAEGVYCGTIPHAGIGIAVKCDDGASRAAEIMFTKALSELDVWTTEEQSVLDKFLRVELKNRNDIVVGELRVH